MKKLVFAGLLGVATLFATGCATACEKATNTIEDKQRECGLTIPDNSSEAAKDAECSEARADQQERFAACIKKASCDDVRTGAWTTKC